MFHVDLCYDTSILKDHASQGYWASGLGASGILGANMSGFAIGVTGQDAPVSPTQPTIGRLTIRRRRGVGLRGYDPERAWRSAFVSKFGSTSARPALLGTALGASLGQAWRQLRRWIARSRQRPALAELDDRLLRDIGVIRERDIGVSREETRRDIEQFWRT